MKNKKYIMVIGGGLQQVELIKTGKRMGLGVIVTDGDSEAMGLGLSEYPRVMSTKDIEGTVRVAEEMARRVEVVGVLTNGTDVSRTVSAVAEVLGLPGIKRSVAELATNKVKMRKKLEEAGFGGVKFKGCMDLKEGYEAVEELGFPCVVKPSENMGARGVKRIDSKEDFRAGYELALGYSSVGEVIVEEYLEGDELSVDALIEGGRVHILGIADRLIGRGEDFVEEGHILPTGKSGEVIEEVKRVMEGGVRGLGLDMGGAKGDIKVTEGGVKIVELAARLSGGFMSGYTYRYATGSNILEWAIEIAMRGVLSGGEIERMMDMGFGGVSMEKSIILPTGVIEKIEGVAEAKAMDGVKHIFMNIQEGDWVKRARNNVEKNGHVIVSGADRRSVEEVMEEVFKTIRIQVREGSI